MSGHATEPLPDKRLDFIRALIRDGETAGTLVRPTWTDDQLIDLEREALADWQSAIGRPYRTWGQRVVFTATPAARDRILWPDHWPAHLLTVTNLELATGGIVTTQLQLTTNYTASTQVIDGASYRRGRNVAMIVVACIRDTLNLPALNNLEWVGRDFTKVAEVHREALNLGIEVWMMQDPPMNQTGNLVVGFQHVPTQATLQFFHVHCGPTGSDQAGWDGDGEIVLRSWERGEGAFDGVAGGWTLDVSPTEATDIVDYELEILLCDARPGADPTYTTAPEWNDQGRLGTGASGAWFFTRFQQAGQGTTTMDGTWAGMAPAFNWLQLCVTLRGGIPELPLRLVRIDRGNVRVDPVPWPELAWLAGTEGRLSTPISLGCHLYDFNRAGYTIQAFGYPRSNTGFQIFTFHWEYLPACLSRPHVNERNWAHTCGTAPGYNAIPSLLNHGDLSETNALDRVVAYRACSLMGESDESLQRLLVGVPERMRAAFSLGQQNQTNDLPSLAETRARRMVVSALPVTHGN